MRLSQLAPDFGLPDLSGNTVSLSDYKERIVLLDFWATWCVPCRKTLPELVSIDRKYRGNGVTVLGLAIDDPDSYDALHIKNFIKKHQVAYTILRADPQIIHQYLGHERPEIPALFIIDPNGRIVEKIIGVTDGKKVEAILEKLLQNQHTPSEQ